MDAPEDFKLVERIALDGKVDDVKTNDDKGHAVGIVELRENVLFSGEVIVQEGLSFPFSKEMQDRISWLRNYASVRFVTSPSPIDPSKIEVNLIKSYYGKAIAKYRHHYSDLTGYLYTSEDFNIGGHDLLSVLKTFRGQYIHFEMELYEKTK